MTNHDNRSVSVRSVRRDPPDFRQLGRAFLELAMASRDSPESEKTGRPKPARDDSQADGAALVDRGQS